MTTYGTLKATTLNGVKIYSVSGGKTLPEWLSERKKRALRKDEGKRSPRDFLSPVIVPESERLILLPAFAFFGSIDYLKRIELIQDMEFPSAATKIKQTSDGQYLIASGKLLCEFLSFHSSFDPDFK